ncbi:MAG: GGDEF domain-containing protein [Burkholderiaceae bacterium]
MLRLAIGLAALSTLLLVFMEWGLSPPADPNGPAWRAQRIALVELASAQMEAAIANSDFPAIEAQLDLARQRIPDILAANVRNNAGQLIANVGPAIAAPPSPSAAAPDDLVVPLLSPDGPWGHAQFRFRPHDDSSPLQGWLGDRWFQITIALPLLLAALSYLYLRRALLYLDPMSVVPDRLRTAFDGLTEGIALVDRIGRVVLSNRAFREMAAVEEKRMNGRPLQQAVRMELPPDMEQAPWHAVASTGRVLRATRVHVGDGPQRKVGNMNCSPVIDGRGKIRGCLVTLSDITAVERTNDQLRATMDELVASREHIHAQNQELIRLAMHDGLTSLLNRRAFFQQGADVLDRLVRARADVAVLMMDVDHFKSFNDRFGHSTGDVVLQRVASCLKNSLPVGGMAARYGGEEFCALIENAGPDSALAIAERVRATIQAEAGLGVNNGADLTVTVSIGVATSPLHGTALPNLIKLADEALYHAKRSGRNKTSLANALANSHA